MIDEKANRIAELVKAFGACMTAPSVREHFEHAVTFNELFDDYLESYPEESAASIARHVTLAIQYDPGDPEESVRAINGELLARILPDVLYVLGLSVDQDTRPALEQVS